MVDVQYPQPQFRIRKEEAKTFIFDAIRKAWLLLTEEEWVRQNFVNYLCVTCNYPVSSIALEKEIMLNGLKKRFDILIYNKQYKPWMLVECKAPSVPLSEQVLQQVLRYNMTVPVDYMVIVNGPITIAWEKKEGRLSEISSLPKWR